ncbi:hypothetical protein ABW20_dc0108047 [Dactylellina cionopaga]|nr:hypothetical protein ABW20_dc0108047 [Dactylellina cionopaga]
MNKCSWHTDIDLEDCILEQLGKHQRSLEGFWTHDCNWGSNGKFFNEYYKTLLAKIGSIGAFKHIHFLGLSDQMAASELLINMILSSATELKTLTIEPLYLFDNMRRGLGEYELHREAESSYRSQLSRGTILRKHLVENNCLPKIPNDPLKFPSLRHLSLVGLDKSILTEFPILTSVVDVSLLTVLKLSGGDQDATVLTSCLIRNKLHLKVLHLMNAADGWHVEKILSSFDSLEELKLCVEYDPHPAIGNDPNQPYYEYINELITAIGHHASLKHLYWEYWSFYSKEFAQIDKEIQHKFLKTCCNLKEFCILAELVSDTTLN